MKKAWYITGASKGLGLALAKKLLEEGYQVAATSRNKQELVDAVGTSSPDFLPLEVNLTSISSIQRSVQQTAERFGKLDVVVNNAGYGMGGTVEEFSNEEIQQSFSVNVFAPIYVMQAALPVFRTQKSGHIINISSIAGLSGNTGWAVYSATKSAINGLSEVLAQDLKSLGIAVTAVAPGAFRTAFLTNESLVFAEKHIEAYEDVHLSHQKYRSMNGQQVGNPEKAAKAFIDLTNMPQPPTTLHLGSDAYRRAREKLKNMERSLDEYKTISESTDY